MATRATLPQQIKCQQYWPNRVQTAAAAFRPTHCTVHSSMRVINRDKDRVGLPPRRTQALHAIVRTFSAEDFTIR